MTAPAPAPPAAAPLPLGLLVAVSALLVAVVHGSALGHGFVHDDLVLLRDSQRLGELGNLGPGLVHDLFWLADGAVRPSPYWRPVVTGSYFVERALGGGSSLVFHLGNLVVLALLAVVAARPVRDRLGQLLVLVVVVAHPLQAEVAANITARTDTLVALFGTLAVLSPGALGAGLTLLALGSKETAVVVPVLAWLRGRSQGQGGRAWAPHLAAVLGWLLLRQALVTSWGLSAADRAGPSSSSLAGAAGRVLFYLGRVLWPTSPVPARQLPDAAPLGAMLSWVLLLVAGLAVAWLLRLRRRATGSAPSLALALGTLVLPLVPVSGLLAARVRYAEGFLCWPLVGLAWLMAAAPRGRVLLLLLALGVVPLTRQETAAWHDETSLWEQAWQRRPHDPVVALRVARVRYRQGADSTADALQVALGGPLSAREGREAQALAARLALDAGDEARALLALRQAADPTDPEATWALAARCVLEVASGGAAVDGPPLAEVCAEALRRRPDDPDLHNARGILLARAGALEQARAAFARAVELAPQRAELRANLAQAERDLGRWSADETFDEP